MLKLQTNGSFGTTQHEESAMGGGHAAAIGRMIGWLTDQLPDAIALDHQLHDRGEKPPSEPFGRSVDD